eukprot:3464224-Alexandrium_andersonii.AAC.1
MRDERLALPASELPAFGSSRPTVASAVARAPPHPELRDARQRAAGRRGVGLRASGTHQRAGRGSPSNFRATVSPRRLHKLPRGVG